MNPILKYAWQTLKHKYFVFKAGMVIGDIPLWQLLIHDLSKFGPWELKHYGRQFFGDKGDPMGFTIAWTHHQNTNPHHWEWWIPRTAHNRGGFRENEPLPMTRNYAREMVADWVGASRAYEGQWPQSRASWKWLVNEYPKIRLHPVSKTYVEIALDDYFMNYMYEAKNEEITMLYVINVIKRYF